MNITMDVKKIRGRLTGVIFLSQTIFSAGTIIVFSILSITAVQISGQESFAGLPSSLLSFTPALVALPLSIFINRIGWRTGLTLGYLIGGAGALFGVYAIFNESLPALLLGCLLFGTARAGADLSRFAVGGMYEEKRRGTMIGRVVFSSAIGAIVGPLLVPIGIALISNFQIPQDAGAWVVAALMYILAGIISFLLLRPDPKEIMYKSQIPDRKTGSNHPQSSVFKLFKAPKVQLAVSAMAVSQMVMVVLMVMTPLHIHKLHQGHEVISYVISAHALGMFGLAALTGYLIDRFGVIPMIFGGLLILASSAIIAPLSKSGIILAFALFLLGLGWNFCYVAGSTLLSTTLPQNAKGKIQGVNDSLIAAIAGTGSLAAGPLFSLGGYFALSMTGLLITLLLSVLIFILARSIKLVPVVR
jgi:MFS family permease